MTLVSRDSSSNWNKFVVSARPTIVAVDGPAGSGKTSICSAVCQRLGWGYLNTGALYRAIGFLCARAQVDPSDGEQLKKITIGFVVDGRWDPETGEISYRGENLTESLHSAQAGVHASVVAKDAAVRELLLPLQRRLAMQSKVATLVEGRDIGTVVFPDADLKIFMRASLEQRAQRRLAQLSGSEPGLQLDDLMAEIAGRDNQDSTRGAAPLRQADDAIAFENSAATLEEAVQELIATFRKCGLKWD